MRRAFLCTVVGVGALTACQPIVTPPPPSVAEDVSLVPGTSCPLFPADNAWHADISSLPVHPRSADWLASSGASSRRLHPDFGTSDDPANPYGIPFQVVDGTFPKVPVSFMYDDESDQVLYPIGPSTWLEGASDRHALVVDASTCMLYETWATEIDGTSVSAGSGATWDLRSNALRPAGWTSADAAGLPILPGLVRVDELEAGHIDHAIRMTVSRTDRSYLWPARHQAGSRADATLPPMGARFRLRADVDLTRYAPETQVVLRAMQRHGMIVADNGSNWFFQGAASNDWPDQVISELKSVPASWFEAVDTSSLMVDPNSAEYRHS